MRLRRRLRRFCLRNGYRLPEFLIEEHDRVFYDALATVRPGTVMLDIGAHRGETALAFAARGAEVHAFEPNPDIYPELVETARRYPGIRHHHAGILDADGEMPLYLHESYGANPRRHSESSSFLAEKPNVTTADYRVVPVRDIAEVVRAVGRPIDIVKIDAEGSEYRILRRLIESGAVAQTRAVYVEPHWDRIPGLAAEHAAVAALIAERGLDARIRFDWP